MNLLPEIFIHSKANKVWQYSGIDSPEYNLDSEHFLNYPHAISYRYNSRGFRDQEWPHSLEQLQNCIWCVGDSFTVGVGQPIQHIWPQRLSAKTGLRTINVSMDGASNQWISRTAQDIIQQIAPKHLVIMWSYTHRRELDRSLLVARQWMDQYNKIRQNSWPCVTYDQRDSLPLWIQSIMISLKSQWAAINAENLRLSHDDSADDFENWQNFLQCKKNIDTIGNAVQFAIPHFHPMPRYAGAAWTAAAVWNALAGDNWPSAPQTVSQLDKVPDWIISRFRPELWQYLRMSLEFADSGVHKVSQVDLARDGHHFDIITADWVAECVVRALEI